MARVSRPTRGDAVLAIIENGADPGIVQGLGGIGLP